MELRAFIRIFIVHRRLFFGIIALCIAGSFLYYALQEKSYSASLTLTVARTGSVDKHNTFSQENYQSFYRLQADERFADTIVRWLEAPRIVEDILIASDNMLMGTFSERALRTMFEAKRLSSQVIDVHYSVREPSKASVRADAIIARLNDMTANLNSTKQNQGWFTIVGEEPIVRLATRSLPFMLIFGSAVGVFLAFLSVLFWHYYKLEE